MPWCKVSLKQPKSLEDRDIPIIAAGSLLEVRLKETKQKIPVGRIEYFFLGPLTFTEFLLASVYNRLSPAKSTYVKSALDILDGVFLVQKVFYSSASGLLLKQGEDPDIFKTYFLDVGLYHCMLDVKWRDLVGLDYDNLLSKGAMAEQFIAQHLFLGSGKTTRTRVHYWLREKSADNAEVDFVTNFLNKIIPIKVKAGKSGRIKSLIQFMEEKRSLVTEAVRFDLAYREKFLELVSCKFTDGKRRDELNFKLYNLPLYCIESLEAVDFL